MAKLEGRASSNKEPKSRDAVKFGIASEDLLPLLGIAKSSDRRVGEYFTHRHKDDTSMLGMSAIVNDRI
jgi:hypothetical protein